VFQPTLKLAVPANITNKTSTAAWVQVNREVNGESLCSLELVNMKFDPNRSYQGQEVMIVNGNFKGYLGRITSTTTNETVLVEISATMQKVPLKLSELSLS
jgi:transcription antitermination factor NusG